MRAKEFLKENSDNLASTHKSAIDNMIAIPDMDAFYDFYRFMNVIAAEPYFNVPASGKLRDNPVALGYTSNDVEMIKKAAKHMGKKISFLSPSGSNELDGTNKISPVASKKKNKYNV